MASRWKQAIKNPSWWEADQFAIYTDKAVGPLNSVLRVTNPDNKHRNVCIMNLQRETDSLYGC